MRELAQNFEFELQDTKEHVILLQQKCKDESGLPKLRGKLLDQAKVEIKNLSKTVDSKEQVIQRLEQHIQALEQEDRTHFEVQRSEIQKLIEEINRLRLINEGLKKDKNSMEDNQFRSKDQFEQYIKRMQIDFDNMQKDYEHRLEQNTQQSNHLLSEMDRKIKKLEKQLKIKDSQLEDCHSVISQKDSIIAKIEKENNKAVTEMRSYQERCKEIEQEMEQIKGFENNSIYNNQSSIYGKNNMSTLNQTQKNNNFDFEVKKIKDMFTQQLTKAKEEANKYKTQFKEAETKIKLIEEENKKKLHQSIAMTSERFEKDQELINELNKTKQQVLVYKQLEQDIRDCFNLSDKEDIAQKMLSIREETETVHLLEKELEKLQNQMKEAQLRELKLIENQTLNKTQNSSQNNKEGNMSNFTANLLTMKNKEIESLRKQYEREKDAKINLEDQVWKIQYAQKKAEEQNKDLQYQIEEAARELTKTKESRDRAEKNVDELKEKLRVMIREQEESHQMTKQKEAQREKFLDEIERKKYEELIQRILELDLAADPLSSANISLQESFIDEFEQALKHLEEQSKLVQEVIGNLRKDKQILQQERQHLNDQIQSINTEVGAKQQQIESLKREIQQSQNSYKEQLNSKERQIDILSVETQELQSNLEYVSKQLKEMEDQYAKLRAEHEEVNINFRKVMRAQEALHKGNTLVNESMISKKGSKANLTSSLMGKEGCNHQQEIERLMMNYEDQIGKLIQKVEMLKAREAQLVQQKETQKQELLQTLDKLIDTRTNKIPVMNDLSLQINNRLDKVRNQERLKLSSHTQNHPAGTSADSLQNSQAFLNQAFAQQPSNILTNFRQELDTISNEEELIQSIGKWLKQSQGLNPKEQTAQFKNFFTQEDNQSLMLSELLVNKNQPNLNQDQEHQELISRKDDQINEHLQTIQQLSTQISKKDSQIQELKAQIKMIQESKDNSQVLIQEIQSRNQVIKGNEEVIQSQQKEIERLQQKIKEIEALNQSKTQQIWQEVEQLKSKIKSELLQKTQQLDNEYEELEALKAKQQEQLLRQQQQLDQKFSQKMHEQEQEFNQRLKKMENDIKSGCEQSKEEQINQLIKRLQEEGQSRVKSLQEEHSAQVNLIKQEHSQKLEELKRQKEREQKKLKEEIDRLKKSQEDKSKKQESEQMAEKEALEREYKEKIEALVAKGKKEVKNAQDKVRAEMRNQVDTVKNDLAKAKAEFERERKKLLSDFQSDLEQQKRTSEELLQSELKSQKERLDKQFKKKLEDKAAEGQKKVEEIENEIQKIRESHKEEIKKERERMEIRITEQVRAQVRLEVHQELEIENQEQIERMRQQQQMEIDRIKTKYEVMMREEKASYFPTQVQSKPIEKRSQEIQCELLIERDIYEETEEDMVIQRQNQGSQNSNQVPYSQSHNSNNTSYQSQQQQMLVNNSLYLDQLKHNFEEELERQQQIFEVQLISKQQTSVRVFEELLTLEFDKILQSIYHKSNQGNAKQTDLENKRHQINKLIADILNRNDDRKEFQMRSSLENLKKKISEVLRVFKTELENKLNKKQEAMMKEQIILKEKLKIHNMSDIVSVQQNTQNNYSDINSQRNESEDYRSDYCSEQNISQVPTPRDMMVDKETKEFERYLNHSNEKQGGHQLSDIKKYAQEEAQEDNILKKVSPVPNQNGVLVVEVDKVVRDLNMLMQTMKQAKFYRLLISVNESQESQNSDFLSTQDLALQKYRQILNDFFRIVVKLNQGMDQMSKTSEVYKLKLLNTELKAKLQKLENQQESLKASLMVEDILTSYLREQQIHSETQKCLQVLENSQFQINKLQFKMFTLVDLFTCEDNSSQINRNFQEVNQKCKIYLEQFPHEINDNLLIQSQSPDKGNFKISPEMLSPEETAQLIATVFQRLNNTGLSSNIPYNQSTNNLNNQLDSQQSFFKTFLSNDEYVRSAENFIRKFKGAQMTQTNNQQNLPLQMTNPMYNRTGHSYSQVQILNQSKKRSKSQQSNQNNMSCQIPNQSQHYVSNVFQSNLLERQNSILSYQPHMASNFDLQSQGTNKPPNYQMMHQNQSSKNLSTIHTQHNISQYQLNNYNTQSQPNLISHNISQQQLRGNFPPRTNRVVNKSVEMKMDELAQAQNNVNNLFEKLKLNFQNQSVNGSRDNSFQ